MTSEDLNEFATSTSVERDETLPIDKTGCGQRKSGRKMKFFVIVVIACTFLFILFSAVWGSVAWIYSAESAQDHSESQLERQTATYNDMLEKLFDDSNAVEKTEICLTLNEKGNKTYDLYKLEGSAIQDVPLKAILEMLQNWYNYVEHLAIKENLRQSNDSKAFTRFLIEPRFFQLNIGGSDFTFGLSLKVNSKDIFALDTEGNTPDYATMFKHFGSSEQIQIIAKNLIDAAEHSLIDQPNWEETMTKSSEKLRNYMKMFLITLQTTVRVHSSGHVFNSMKLAITDVMNLESLQFSRKPEVSNFLIANFYNDNFSSDAVIAKDKIAATMYSKEFLIFLEKFQSGMKELQYLQKLNESGKEDSELKERMKAVEEYIELVRLEISKHLPDHTSHFYMELVAHHSDGGLVVFLEQGEFDVHAKGYDIHKLESLIKQLEGIPTNEWDGMKGLSIKREIENHLPSKTSKFCEDLVSAVNKQFLHLKSEVEMATKVNKENFENDEISGGVSESLLKNMTMLYSLIDEFRKIFSLTKVGGLLETQKCNKGLIYEANHEKQSMADFEEFQGYDHNQAMTERINPKQKSVMDATAEELMKSLNEQLHKICARKSCGKLIKDSVEFEHDMLLFDTINEKGIKASHEIEYHTKKLAFTKYLREKSSSVEEASTLAKKVGLGVNVYGILLSAAGAIEQFENGNYGQGVFSATQTLHSIGKMFNINKNLQRIIFRRSWNLAAEKFGFSKLPEKLAIESIEGLGESGKIFARFLEDIPFVGLGMDIYFLTQDIIDLANKKSSTPEFLKITHLILDFDTTILSLASDITSAIAPEFAPVFEVAFEAATIALSIIRMSIDYFYSDIKTELDHVKGKGFGVKLVAFMKGYGEAIADIFTGGLASQILELEHQKKIDKQLFYNMSHLENYFNKTLANKGTVDFNGGIMSQFGGFLTVALSDDGCFTMELPEVYNGNTPPTSIKRKFCNPHSETNDIVLGIGTVSSPEFVHKETKLWGFIPVKSYEVIEKFVDHRSSRYGTYYGNNHNNTFYALQRNDSHKSETPDECHQQSFDQNSFNELLDSYHYKLYGLRGNDRFFLGPESSNVFGNDGKDLYFIPHSGGKTVINNFALDEQKDMLYMNLSYSDLFCYRKNQDLIVSYCDTHVAIVKHWFAYGSNAKYFRHIDIVTKDEVVISVTNTSIKNDQYETLCHPISIDKSRSLIAAELDLQDEQFQHVTRVVGSNYSDNITGNDKDNALIGRLGNDFLLGGAGQDVYVINEGDGADTINNFAIDNKTDTVLFGFNYSHISVKKQLNDLVMFSQIDASTSVTLQSWFHSTDYQHVVFTSKDYITFIVTNDEGNYPNISAITIDFSNRTEGVTLNLQHPDLNNETDIDEEVTRDVKLIIDSPYDDTIVGNVRNNIMSCSGGCDYLQGNNGSDTYVVKQACECVEIYNEDDFKEYDLLLLSCSPSSIGMSFLGDDLIINCTNSDQYPPIIVTLLNWFASPVYQHLMVKTLAHNQSYSWTFIPPEKKDNFSSYIEPYEVETNQECSDNVKTLNLSSPPFLQVTHFKAKSSNCRFNVIGNSLNNYIDPGPSDSYGYQTLTGGNGSDTYVFGHLYGKDNAINNYATDEQYDHLLFNVIYENIQVNQSNEDAILSSISPNDSVSVTLMSYAKGKQYQHLLIHASNRVVFQIEKKEYAFIKQIVMVDYSHSSYCQIISPSANNTLALANVRAILGSQTAVNSINGSNLTMKIVGGKKNDRIIGGSFFLGEDIIGLDGDDYIDGQGGDDSIMGGDGQDILKGGEGNDIIYGGKGADTIDGGNGSDTIVFSGNGTIRSGVMINLQLGRGWYGDAAGDQYESVENILGSEYNDSLIGSDDDNVIRGYGGEDYIIPGGGLDVLQGGLDADIYDMKNAYGLKVINNYATDKANDIILLSTVKHNQLCYFFNNDSLHLVIDFSNKKVVGAMRRVVLAEQFLEIKMLHVLLNETYCHFDVVLSDLHVLPYDKFLQKSYQTKWISDELMQEGKVLHVTSVTSTSLVLELNISSVNYSAPLPNNAQLYYSHNQDNSVTSHPFSSSSGTIKINNLKGGVIQMFSVFLMSCNVKVAISPITFVTTLPNPPSNTNILNTVVDGFTIGWIPPMNTTDPNVHCYNYTIKYWLTDNPQKTHSFEFSEQFLFRHTIYGLTPRAYYTVAIASIIDGIEGHYSSPVTVRTNSTVCTNFEPLPAHMHIETIKPGNGSKLLAYLYCDENYTLTGNKYIVCNETSMQKPQCTLSYCAIPSNESLYYAYPVSIVKNKVLTGETVEWNCSEHYWTPTQRKTQFNSTCVNGQWLPLIQPCVLKIACPNYPFIRAGQTIPKFAYVNEKISFKCDPYHTRLGPEEKVCKMDDLILNTLKYNSLGRLRRHADVLNGINFQSASVYYYPKTAVKCVRYKCPLLYPQLHGNYSLKGDFYSGDSVILTCHLGYYIRDDYYSPENITLTCTKNGTWNMEQKICQPILEVVPPSKMKLFQVTGKVRYAVQKLANVTILPSSLYQFACDILGGFKPKSISGMEIICTIDFQLANHPALSNGSTNTFAGVPSIVYNSTGNSSEGLKSEKFCVTDDSASEITELVCHFLGYGQYTSTIETSPTTYTATAQIVYEDGLYLIVNKMQQCDKMISCRATCQQIADVANAASQCNKVYEDETCSIQCKPGCKKVGTTANSITCLGNQTWSPEDAISFNCDADNSWIADVVGYMRKYHSHMHHHDHTAEYIAHDLSEKYPDVTWVVTVFDPNRSETKLGYSASADTFCKCNYYDISVCVSRLTTPRVTTDTGHNMTYKLSKSYSPVCIDDDIVLSQTVYSTVIQLQTQFKVNVSSLLLFAHDSGHSTFAARKDSDSSYTNSSKEFIGTLPWDHRVATYVATECIDVFAVVLEQ